jgi:hypothetical protein
MVGMNDYTLDNFRRTVDVWYNMYPVFNNCEQLRQPIYFNDVAQCVLNALKLHESCGQTYELGGPNVYTRREMFEIMINLLDRPISLQYVNKDLATMFAKYFVNWRYFSLDQFRRKTSLISSSPSRQRPSTTSLSSPCPSLWSPRRYSLPTPPGTGKTTRRNEEH